MKKTSLKIFTVLMVGMLFLQTNYLLVFYGLFQLNRDALTEEVCEKVVEKCNACCYLNKQMNEEEQNANSNTEPVRKNEPLVIICNQDRRTACRAQHQICNPLEHGALHNDHATSIPISRSELCSIWGVDASAD